MEDTQQQVNIDAAPTPAVVAPEPALDAGRDNHVNIEGQSNTGGNIQNDHHSHLDQNYFLQITKKFNHFLCF